MKKLNELTWHEYNTLKNMGFLLELYPEAPNTYGEIFKEENNRGGINGLELNLNIEQLPEITHDVILRLAKTIPEVSAMYCKINEIIRKLNGE